MTRKVIYVSQMRLSEKTSRDWYVDYLIAKGVTVEYWDVGDLFQKEYGGGYTKTADYLRTIRTYGEIEEMLRIPENKDAYYVMLVSYMGVTARLFRLLSKYNCKMLFIAWGALPERDVQRQQRRLLIRLSDPLGLAERIFYRAKASAYRKLGLVRPYEMVFAAGQAEMSKKHYAKKVVPINLCDYDHYRQIKTEGTRLVAGRYAVFLDVYMPYHPDHKLVGGKMIDPGDYYASLNRFFALLEAKYEIRVVIAAHPKADYGVNPFGGREVHLLQTPLLARDAEFVIAHHSTSLSYAVLNHKPLIFAYTNEMAAWCMDTVVSYMYSFAKYLDAAICNIDEIFMDNQIAIREVNHECYEKYKYDFLTSHESENEISQEVFWRELN